LLLLLPLLSAWRLAALQLDVDRRRRRHVTTASLLWLLLLLLLPLQAANAVHALLLALLLLLLLTALLLLQPDRALVHPCLLGRPAELLHAGLTRIRCCCCSD
jgi:hypothetical protein